MIYLDAEVEINELDKKVKPDYVIYRSNTNQAVEGTKDTPLFVIEAKRGDQ